MLKVEKKVWIANQFKKCNLNLASSSLKNEFSKVSIGSNKNLSLWQHKKLKKMKFPREKCAILVKATTKLVSRFFRFSSSSSSFLRLLNEQENTGQRYRILRNHLTSEHLASELIRWPSFYRFFLSLSGPVFSTSTEFRKFTFIISHSASCW